MLTKYPSPATAVKAPVLTACQEVPPATSTQSKLPDPSVLNVKFFYSYEINKATEHLINKFVLFRLF